jgi:hypothetical protein
MQVRVTDSVKRAASAVLRVTNLDEFKTPDIRKVGHAWAITAAAAAAVLLLLLLQVRCVQQVVEIVASVSSLVSAETYSILNNILYMLFKMTQAAASAKCH